jgi:hypothetical protein
MTTLKEIVDDIILTSGNSVISSSDKLSFNQVALWVNQYRALLIRRDIEKLKKGSDIPEQYTQMLQGLRLKQVPRSEYDNQRTGVKTSTNNVLMETEELLPRLIVLKDRPSVITIFDLAGNKIQWGDRVRSRYQQFRRYTCNDYMAYLQNDKIRVEGPRMLEYIDVHAVLENPFDASKCGFADEPYPIPEDRIPILKQMIFTQELGLQQAEPSDTTTNSQDDTLNNMFTLGARTRQSALNKIARQNYEN